MSFDTFLNKVLRIDERKDSEDKKKEEVRRIRRENEREINDLLSLAETVRDGQAWHKFVGRKNK